MLSDADTIERLREGLARAQGTIAEQNELLTRLTTPPVVYATVVAVNPTPPSQVYKIGDRVLILSGRYANTVGTIDEETGEVVTVVPWDKGETQYYRLNESWRRYPSARQSLRPLGISTQFGSVVVLLDDQTTEVLLPEGMSVRVGDTVKVSKETQQIVGVAHTFRRTGEVATVRRLIDAQTSEVDYQSSRRTVFNGKVLGIEKGSLVVLDSTGTIVLDVLKRDDDRFLLAEKNGISWDDIGGLGVAKRELMEAIISPHKDGDLYRHYNAVPPKGILLIGPPGNGKTLLARAVATAMSHEYNGSYVPSAYIYVKGPEILEPLVGVAEANVRSIFARARRHQKEFGFPAIIFIDEAEAILRKRGTGISSDVQDTIVPMFLAEWDGLEDSGAIVILATNRPDILDPAVVRDKRVDRKIFVGRPDRQAAMQIFRIHLRNVPVASGTSSPVLASIGVDEIFSPSRVFAQVHLSDGRTIDLTLASIASGALIANVVGYATQLAMRRDRERRTRTGLTNSDVREAVANVFEQNAQVDHTDDLSELVRDIPREKIVRVEKLHTAARS